MPWSGKKDVSRHNQKAGSDKKKSAQWLKVANSVLKETGDDGRAVREANSVVKHSRGGGVALKGFGKAKYL